MISLKAIRTLSSEKRETAGDSDVDRHEITRVVTTHLRAGCRLNVEHVR